MKISYRKNWSKDGTFYNQTITIDWLIAHKFNQYIIDILQKDKKEIKKTHIISNEQSQRQMFLEPLKLGVNFTHLTTLEYFMSFYLKTIYEAPKKDRDFERILNRNTIFIVE